MQQQITTQMIFIDSFKYFSRLKSEEFNEQFDPYRNRQNYK